MAALVCLGCSAVYSVSAPKCPQCGSTESRGDWEESQQAAVVRGEPGPEPELPAGQKVAATKDLSPPSPASAGP